jgi:hypothetical protein
LAQADGKSAPSWEEARGARGGRISARAEVGEGLLRHEGGVEPLALSCSTDLKSAPRTDEDHHGQKDRWAGSSLGAPCAVGSLGGRQARLGTAGRRTDGRGASDGTTEGRHEGGVEPLALSCSTDLKSAPRTDEDHHGQRGERGARCGGCLRKGGRRRKACGPPGHCRWVPAPPRGRQWTHEGATRHEGGVEPLALSCSTDLKSAPRTDEDHHGPNRNLSAGEGGLVASGARFFSIIPNGSRKQGKVKQGARVNCVHGDDIMIVLARGAKWS